jgi:hypothetical protein
VGLAQPKINELHLAMFADQEVVGLYIAVAHTALMGVLEPFKGLRQDRECLGEAERFTLNQSGERNTLNELHFDVKRLL